MAKRLRQRSHRATTNSNTYRFFVDPATIRGDDVWSDDATLVHQLANVLRLEPGMAITLLDNTGWEYNTVLDAVERHYIQGSIESRREASAPHLDLTLYIALLKGERFEWVIQKGTELGVAAFVPVITEHSVIDDARTVGTAKVERWERIIREAAEQSRRGYLPRLEPVQPFAHACEQIVASRTLLLWEGNTAVSLREALRSTPTTPISIALFSGPEGGWSAAEIDIATEYNVECVTLGPRILRAETAPLAAIAATMFEYGEME